MRRLSACSSGEGDGIVALWSRGGWRKRCASRGGSALRFGAYFTVVPASSRVRELLVYNLDAPTAAGDELYALQRAQRVFLGQAAELTRAGIMPPLPRGMVYVASGF